ncbi:hypothetical protein [Streptomyces sp. NPDC012888]|uniref:hypothetical protein n=1 Tax=Streptomyces sp. NPDC012888 TaxID=3364855 RepID=UPI0036C45A99
MRRRMPRPAGRHGGAATDRTRAAVADAHQAGERRTAVALAALAGAALAGADAAAGMLTWQRAALWALLGGVVFVVLVPPLVSAAPGRLTSRGLFTERTVRTDALVSVRWSDGVARRLVLRDAGGRRVEIDPGVLVRNPALWHRLDTDLRLSAGHGRPVPGTDALRQLREHVDGAAARAVFDVSGLGQDRSATAVSPPSSTDGASPG